LLSNVYLHDVLDQWADRWRQAARGEITIVRYADDAILGFEHQHEAERYHRELREHWREYGLELNEDKTRLIRFGRLARENRRRSPSWDSSISAGTTGWAGNGHPYRDGLLHATPARSPIRPARQICYSVVLIPTLKL
jgi:hypothetical protein